MAGSSISMEFIDPKSKPTMCMDCMTEMRQYYVIRLPAEPYGIVLCTDCGDALATRLSSATRQVKEALGNV